ncbi:MAG: SHOCT domain-containing protein [Firmicutes bacterium]|nr:SHOCT domain-containing protein [Bacillota bacterium]HOB34308.1 SHOCT domain-containing protein [Bacillota bacterium]HPZ90685.1 SHOCT domain-containing protein [Bacillota bacterium]HQE01519.1 SHOCT domain-containing protein [Bacillota bacterium]
MHRRIRVRPGRAASVAGVIAGAAMVIIGLTTVTNLFGLFGIIWTLIAVAITVMHAINAFTEKGMPVYEVNVEGDNRREEDYTRQLLRLKQLKDDGIITETEFNMKKQEILAKKW